LNANLWCPYFQFPPDSLKREYFTGPTATHTQCPWKGSASYYTLNVDGQEMTDAAWFYPEPFEKATHIKDFVAFCEFFSQRCLLLRKTGIDTELTTGL
jgi:uncharacterized protein (DUF427 family)